MGGSHVLGQSLPTLHGSVTDPSGAPIPNATVHLINSVDNFDRTASTDAGGNFAFSDVITGTYRLLIEAAGFETYEKGDLHLPADAPAILEIKLKIKQVQQNVTVRGQQSDQCLAPQERIVPEIGPGLRAIRRGPSGNYYVLTSPGVSAAIYSPDGKRLGEIPTEESRASSHDSSIVNGADLQIDSAGRIYIADLGANAVKIYAADGKLVREIHVSQPVSVEPVSGGVVAIASLTSQYLVDIYDEARGELYRNLGDLSHPVVEQCDPVTLICTVHVKDMKAPVKRDWFYGDLAGNIYVSIVDPPDPTIRKYDADGYLVYESTFPLDESGAKPANSKWSASSGARMGSGVGTVGASDDDSQTQPVGWSGIGTSGTLSLRITQREISSISKPSIGAMGVDPDSGELWAAIGRDLVHFTQDGQLAGYYCLSTTNEAPLKITTILVEPNRILIGSDPFGIAQYSRPDKPLANAAVPH